MDHPAGLEITVVRTPEAMAEALRIRVVVFVEEQGVWADVEVDEYDADPAHDERVVHILARLEGVPVGTARLLLDDQSLEPGFARIGRVAVLAEHRRRHVGAALMAHLHDEARRRGFEGITISAQLHAVPFYERIAYVARGPVYIEDGIDHRAMTCVSRSRRLDRHAGSGGVASKEPHLADESTPCAIHRRIDATSRPARARALRAGGPLWAWSPWWFS